MENNEQDPCTFCGRTIREQMKGDCKEVGCYRQFLPCTPKFIACYDPFSRDNLAKEDVHKFLKLMDESPNIITSDPAEDEPLYFSSIDATPDEYSIGIVYGSKYGGGYYMHIPCEHLSFPVKLLDKFSYKIILDWMGNNTFQIIAITKKNGRFEIHIEAIQ
jgi:hypothetical protein